MGSANQVDVVFRVELPDHVLTKGEANASIVVSILFDTALGVGPEQVAEKTGIWDISGPHDVLDLIEVPQFW